MKIEPKTLKGFRDFLPNEARKRQYVIDKLKSVFTSYGFEPLETPVLEYEEILSGKYGEEGDRLMYRFEDNGKRRVAMRYDQTVPLARIVAQYKNEITLPFKRYQISNVWRAENTQRGRFREFTQCDIDTVGTDSLLADAEIIEIATSALNELGFKNFKILINDRQNFKDVDVKAVTIIDKLKKIGIEGVKNELRENGYDENLLSEITNKPKSERIEKILEIAFKLESALKDKIVYEPTIARGLSYYTGLIFEIEIDGYDAGSVCGGGRYDNLIGMFANENIPAVGCAFGFDRILEAMDTLKLFPENLQSTKVLVTVFSEDSLNKSIEICEILSKENISQELYIDPTAKMEKQLKYADAKQIPYAVIIGPKEIGNNEVTVKNLKSREQKTVSINDLTNSIN